MTYKKIFLIALLVTLAISFIPLRYNEVSGLECPGKCYEEITKYGFPFIIDAPTGIDHPYNGLDWDTVRNWQSGGFLLVLAIFLMNTLFFAAIIKLLVFLYTKLWKKNSST